MSLSLNSINQNNQNFFANSGDLVTGAELSQVVKEIFSAASTQSTKPTQAPVNFSTNVGNLNNPNSKLTVFGPNGLNAQTSKLIANNQAALNINLSQKATASIDSLKTLATRVQIEGKIAPALVPNTDIKSTSTKESNSNDTDKEEKRSNPFYLVNSNKAAAEETDSTSYNIFS